MVVFKISTTAQGISECNDQVVNTFIHHRKWSYNLFLSTCKVISVLQKSQKSLACVVPA